MKKYKPFYGQPPQKPLEPKQSWPSYKEIERIEIDDCAPFSLPPLKDNQYYYFFADEIEGKYQELRNYYVEIHENIIVENVSFLSHSDLHL